MIDKDGTEKNKQLTFCRCFSSARTASVYA